MIKKLLSLFYNHSETEKNYALNDITGNGYTTSASCGKNSSKTGTEITLRSDKIPLYDLSDEDHPKLLYEIRYYSYGTSAIDVDAYGGVSGSINLRDENGKVIDENEQVRFGNGTHSNVVNTFVLTNYNTDTDYIYIDIIAKASVRGKDGSASTSKTYQPSITCIYYSDPE